ncbi:MAG TPA: hypothetical protein VHD88_06550, partial [Pyrinomonadaceae bacterium]|nr:hypothetical protein [Pyrinomonadaceae bacterium]
MILAVTFVLCATTLPLFAQVGDYEGRKVATVEVVIEGSPPDASAQAEFQSMLKLTSNSEYSAVLVR